MAEQEQETGVTESAAPGTDVRDVNRPEAGATDILDEQTEEEGQEIDIVDALAVLREELEEARAKEAEYLDGWQRARAELANARKRFQRDQARAYDNARAAVLVQLLPIVDDFERAAETVPDDLSHHTWTKGVMLIQRRLQVLLEQAGVTPLAVVGQEFDPNQHEAVTHEPSDTVAAGHVIDEVQTGYSMGDQILRPSVVRVSSGPPAESEAGPEAGEVTSDEG
jgi:molecular chaperone GrpE